jgi:hypothetical protein
MKKRAPKTPVRTRSRRQGSKPMRFRTYSLMLVCGLMLVSGFFFAARQHFASMEYGMKNSRLRKQVDELEAEKRRLLLAREVSLSPAEIKKAARKSGLLDPSANAGVIAQVTSATKEKAVPPTVKEPKSLVIKTGASSASMAKVDTAVSKSIKPAKQLKAEVSAD